MSAAGDPRGGAWLKNRTQVHDTLARVSIEASGLYFELGLWSSKNDTRGVIPWPDLPVAVTRKISAARCRKLVTELARAGVDLVTTTDDGVDLGDFWREENPPGSTWHDQTQRERWARDKRLKRDGELCRRIKARDRNLCRYCGVRVNWNDKVGPLGGTYDHLDPDGENEFSNIVVACRRCNGRKAGRTPEQWIAEDPVGGKSLLRIGTTADQAAAVQNARDGPESGQPPADPGPTPGQPDLAARARDRTESAPGQPPADRPGDATGLNGHAPAQTGPGEAIVEPSTDVAATDEAPPHTDVDAPRAEGHAG